MSGNQSDSWLIIRYRGKDKAFHSEMRFCKDGNVYIDGELYDENNPKYRDYNISSENYSKLNLGEETKKMIESQKTAKKGETVVIKDYKDPNKIEKSTVKF